MDKKFGIDKQLIGSNSSVAAKQFAKLWLKLSKQLKAHMEAELAPGLTEGQLTVLEYLFAKEPERIKPSDLVAVLETSPAAITTLLDRMERNELIVRERDEHDRRIVWLSVTETGKKEGERGMAVRNEFIAAHLDRISVHNQKLLIYLLNKVFSET